MRRRGPLDLKGDTVTISRKWWIVVVLVLVQGFGRAAGPAHTPPRQAPSLLLGTAWYPD
jgi:hypothetical protein